MASSSFAPSAQQVHSSSGRNRLPYHVFINHCGRDTKHKLASSIYDKLHSMGLRIFLDKYALQPGDNFPHTVKEAIAEASLHIAIFSENYAESRWCLDELELMLETKTIIIPIFYHVEPLTLRYVTDGYADAFDNHKKKISTQKLERWKLALNEASFYSGVIINMQREEEAALLNVVNWVWKRFKEILTVPEHSVGLDEAEQEFEKVTLQGAGPTQIVGICGISGIGKTTFARHLYKKKCSIIKRSSFLFNIHEASLRGELHMKQKELLEDLKVVTVANFDNVEDGKEILKSLEFSFVLIILDDVDHEEQLDALLPAREKLGNGSLIIVTTRVEHVLKNCKDISATYNIQPLNRSYAKELFCWHAFGQPSPCVDFEELVEQFINFCYGLPLSLKDLGNLLYREKSKKYWKFQLDKLSRTLPYDIKLRLNITYEALDAEEKEMFLDVACFFIGWTTSSVIAIWNGSEWDGMLGWQKLVNKCLVELNEYNDCIIMHDHLRDLGREIANKQSPYRLWSKHQRIQIQPQQVIQIRGIQTVAFGDNCDLLQGNIRLTTTQGKRIVPLRSLELKIFIGQGDFINEDCSELSSELLCFHCDRFAHKNLPSWLPLKNLRILHLREAQKLEDLWECQEDVPLQLRQLQIGEGCELKKISHLQKLSLLEELRISKCTELKTLPSLAETTSLKTIDLVCCKKLEKIKGLEGLKSLMKLTIDSFAELKTLPSLAEATSLENIFLRDCNKLEKIESLEGLISLEELTIDWCTQLKTLPSLARLTSLKKFNLSGRNKLEKIEGLEGLISLEELRINWCTQLKTLPSLARATSLKKFNLSGFNKLEKIEGLEGLRSLEELRINSCTQLKTLPSLASATSLKKFNLSGSIILEKIEGLEGLRSLEELRIEECTELKTLPSLAELTCLEEFKLRGCQKVDKVEGLKVLTSLKTLEVHMWPMRPCMLKLPEQSERLKSVEVAGNSLVGVEASIREIQRWPREEIICTRAVTDLTSLINFFPENLLERSPTWSKVPYVTIHSDMPESAANANAILICFIIHSIHPYLCFSISTVISDAEKMYFDSAMSNGEWVGMDQLPQESIMLWMGIFPQESDWLRSERYRIRAWGKDYQDVEVEKAWLLRGTEQSVREAFLHLSHS